MRRLDRASGYIITADKNGNKLELETRQCKHCQFTWVYQPGSGIRRGYCMRCNGIVCMEEDCVKNYTCVTLRNWIEGLEKGLPA